MAQSIGALAVQLFLDDRQFQDGMANAEDKVEQFGGNVNKFADKIGNVLVGAFAAATAAITAFGAATVKTGSDFEFEINKVAALSVDGAQNIEALTETARHLGSTTQFTATQAAVAMQEFARAGFDANEIIAASAPALTLAGSAGSSMAESTFLLSAALKQFNLDTSQSTRLSDVFNQVMKESLFTMSSLTEAMKFAGPQGAAFGMSVEETVAAVAQFRDLGMEGSMAGTTFRQMLSKAANVTGKANAELERLGLTQDDINPQFRSFGEIMQTVADAGIDAGSALKIFGIRAGPAVATVAEKFRDGSTNFFDLQTSLENSAGSAAEQYEFMMDTVLAQTDIVRSTIEELMLTVFDTFRGPLKELLMSLSDTIAHTARVFQRSAQDVEAGFGSILVDMTEYLKTNREAIAQSFVGFMNSLAEIGRLLFDLLPLLKTVAQLMVSLFVATRVAAFTGAVTTAIGAVSGLGSAVTALGASLTIASGGLLPLLAGLSAGVVTMGAFVVGSMKASQEAENFANAQEEVRIKNDEMDKQLTKQVENAVQNTQNYAGALQLEMMAAGNLTPELERLLSTMQKLNVEHAKSGITQGTHFAVMIDGKETILSVREAYRLMAAETEHSADIQSGLVAEFDKQQEEINRIKREMSTLNLAYDRYNKLAKASGNEATAFRDALSKVVPNVETYHVRIGELESQLQTATDQQKRFAGETRAASMVIASEDAKAGKSAQKRSKTVVSSANDTSKALDAIREKRIAAEQAAVREYEKATLHEADFAKRMLDEKLAEVRRYYAQEMALLKENSAERDRLLSQAEVAETQIRQAALKERQNITNDAMQALALETQRLQLQAAGDEAGLRQMERDQRIQELENLFAMEIALTEEGSAERMEVEFRILEAISRLKRQFAAEDAERIAQIESNVQNMELNSAINHASRLQRIEMERQQQLASMSEATAEQIARVNRVFDNRVLDEKDQIHREIMGMVRFENAETIELERKASKSKNLTRRQFLRDEANRIRERERLQRELADKLIEYEDASSEDKAAIVADFQAKMDQLDEEGANARKGRVRKILGDIARISVEIARTTVSAIGTIGKATINTFNGLFSTLTGGFNMSVTDAMNDISNEAKNHSRELLDLQEKLDAGEISAEEYDEAFAKLGEFDAEASGKAFGEQIVNDAVAFVRLLVDAAPSFIGAVGAEIPSLFNALVENIPLLAQEIGTVATALLDALIVGIPDFITAIVEAAPDIIMSLVDAITNQLPEFLARLQPALVQLVQLIGAALPVLVEALTAIIPDIIDVIATVIVAIVNELPKIIDALLESLPTIIDALIEGIIKVIVGIINKIPDIIDAVIQNLGPLVTALVSAALDLIIALAENAPILVARIIELIPDLLEAILKMIPVIVGEVLAAIPSIIFGVIKALPTLITAIIGFIPDLITALVTQLPVLAVELVRVLITELVIQIPFIVFDLVVALVDGFIKGISAFFLDIKMFFLKVFAPQKYQEEAQRLFEQGYMTDSQAMFEQAQASGFVPFNERMSAYSGIDFVPANRLVTLHRGEAVLTAQENRARMSGSPGGPSAAQAPAGAPFGGAGSQQPIDIAIMAEGRLLDAVTVTAMDRGQAPKLERKLKQASGVQVGFDRGRFNRYGRS